MGKRQKSKALHAGDMVSWNTSQGRTTGHVVKKQTAKTRIKAHKVAASERNPEYTVRSDKSGRSAAHKAKALKRASR